MKFKNVFTIAALFAVVTMVSCDNEDGDPAVRPTVTATDPISNATGRTLNSKISATFSVEMDASTLTTDEFTLSAGSNSVAGTLEYIGTTASFTPSADLAPNTLYTATITTGAKDLAGTSLALDYVWSFTTGATPDTELPTVVSTNPANGATDVSLNHTFEITFSEPMDATTIIAANFFLMQGTTNVAGEIAYTGTTATFTPSEDLEPNLVYTATLSNTATDMAGNALLSNAIVSFTTGDAPDTALPMVQGTDPLNDATNVTRTAVVKVTFSETMDPATITSSTFTLKEGANNIQGVVTYAGIVASFTPNSDLDPATEYTATINTGATDLAGNALAASTIWSFTTGGSTSPLANVSLGEAGSYVILAQTAINNVSTSAVTGDLGLSPAATSYITGFSLTDFTGYATSAQITGSVYAADMADPTPINLTTAVNNMITAYNDAAGRLSPDFLELGTGAIGGKTLTPGLYKWTTSVTASSDIVISGEPNDVWIFQIAQDLSLAPTVKITLEGGAQAKNIFWQVAGEVVLGTTTHFEGVVMSMTGITLQTGATFNGRALAQTAVVLDSNVVTDPQ